MSNIQNLIKMLQSDNPNKRYDACEELRVSPPPLPQEAIDALNSATNDSNPDVADAARRALALHTLINSEKEQKQELDKTATNSVKNWLPIGLLAGLIPGLIFFVLSFLVWNYDEAFYPICFGSVGIPCGIIGAFIGKRSTKTAWIGAVLGAILGAGLWFLFVINSGRLSQ